MFYRVDETHSTEGTGIGLALTKEFVGIHRGTVSVRSEVGSGSTFTVTIPIDKKAYRSEEIAATPPASADEKSRLQMGVASAEHGGAESWERRAGRQADRAHRRGQLRRTRVPPWLSSR